MEAIEENTDGRDWLKLFNEEYKKESNLVLKQKPEKERQLYWDHLFRMGQWLHFGKDFRTCIEYERSLVGPNEYFSTSNLTEHPDETDCMKKLYSNLPAISQTPEYYKYLYLHDILPGLSRPYPGFLPADIDLQALDFVLNQITDKNVLFHDGRFKKFLQSNHSKSTFNALSTEAINCLLDIKEYMVDEDWLAIKEMYVEFKIKGVIEVSKVHDIVLQMTARCYPRAAAREWFSELTPTIKLAALKLGILFLNLFHICYINTTEERKPLNRTGHSFEEAADAAALKSKEPSCSILKSSKPITKQLSNVETFKRSLQSNKRQQSNKQQVINKRQSLRRVAEMRSVSHKQVFNSEQNKLCKQLGQH